MNTLKEFYRFQDNINPISLHTSNAKTFGFPNIAGFLTENYSFETQLAMTYNGLAKLRFNAV